MNEKIYKSMGVSAIISIATGIIVMVIGITCGIVSIIGGAQLFKRRKDLTI